MSLQCGRWRPPGEYVVPDGMEDLLPRKTWLMHLLQSARTSCRVLYKLGESDSDNVHRWTGVGDMVSTSGGWGTVSRETRRELAEACARSSSFDRRDANAYVVNCARAIASISASSPGENAGSLPGNVDTGIPPVLSVAESAPECTAWVVRRASSIGAEASSRPLGSSGQTGHAS